MDCVIFDKGKSLDEIVTIELFGETFNFKPDEKVENPEAVAEFLKKYVTAAEGQVEFKSSNKNKLAVLLVAAMNLTKDYHELKKKYSRLESDVAGRISSAIQKIDERIDYR